MDRTLVDVAEVVPAAADDPEADAPDLGNPDAGDPDVAGAAIDEGSVGNAPTQSDKPT